MSRAAVPILRGATSSRDPEPPRNSLKKWAQLPDAGPRRAHAVGRMASSASVWHNAQLGSNCGACAMCWTDPPSACMRATTNPAQCPAQSWATSGNTLVVVEHDEDTIRRADHVIDIGPSAGIRGGPSVAEGNGGRHHGDR